MSLKAWRVKVSICQTDSSASPLPTCVPELTSPPLSPVKDGTSNSPPPGRKTATFYPNVKQLLMDLGVTPSASANSKVSKPSLGVRVLRTLFDNSPPTYTSVKSQASASATAAAQAKEQQRLQELQKAQQQAHVQAPAQQGQKNGKARPPTPKKLSGELSRRQPDNHTHAAVIDNLAEKRGRFSSGQTKGGRGNAHLSSKSALVSNDIQSSFHSFDEAQSSVSTDSEYDSSSFYGNTSYHEQEVRKVKRSGVRDLDEVDDLGSGHVDDSLVPDSDAERELESAERMEYLRQEIERLRLENLVLRQRGSVTNHHYDSDLASRASSITEASNAEDAADEWVPYADFAPPGVTSASVARPAFNTQQHPGGHRRGEMARNHQGGRYFPGENAARVVGGGGRAGGHGSASETASMVTDGSRASSRHNSGLLGDPEPQSGLTSRHNSGFQSDQEDYTSMMSWDGHGSRHNSGPLVVDRQELYGLTNNNSSRGNSTNNSGMLVDNDELLRGGQGTVSPLSGTSRVNSRHNSDMQVDREDRSLPPSLASPRISFEGKVMNSNAIKSTLEERFTTHRVVTTERCLVEPEAWITHPSKQNEPDEISSYASHSIPNTYETYDGSSTSQKNHGSHDVVEAPSWTLTPPPSSATQRRSFETRTTPPPSFVDYNVTEGAFGSEHTNTTSPQPPSRRAPTPPRSRDASHELDPTNTSMFSYPIPSMITVPVPRSRSTHSQVDREDLSQFLQHHHSLSMDNAQVINSIPRSVSTHSQTSTEDSGEPSSSAASQHQSTLERLMNSQQRRQNMSSNPMSVNASPDQQYSRNSRQLHNKSPHRR